MLIKFQHVLALLISVALSGNVSARYIQADPIGIDRDYSDPLMQVRQHMRMPIVPDRIPRDLNHPYVYAGSNPVLKYDPLGLDGLYCSRPLGDYSGKNGHGMHIFSCVTLTDGTWRCDSQNNPENDANPLFPDPGVPSKPERDNPNTGQCEKIDDNSNRCFEDCMLGEYDKPRPLYTILGWGQNCREWSRDKVRECLNACGQ